MPPQDLETIGDTLERLPPDQRLALIARLAQSLLKPIPVPASEEKREALYRLRQELAALPVANPADGWSNRDHDRLVYRGGT